MKGVIGARTTEASVRWTVVHAFDKEPPERTYASILEGWSSEPWRAAWLCGAGEISLLGRWSMYIAPSLYEAAHEPGLANGMAAFVGSAQAADCDFAAFFCTADGWRYWEPMERRDVEAAAGTMETARRTHERVSRARRQFGASANMAGRTGVHVRKDVRVEMRALHDELGANRNALEALFPHRRIGHFLESAAARLSVHVQKASTARVTSGGMEALEAAEDMAAIFVNFIEQGVRAALNAAAECPEWQPRASEAR